MHKLLGALLVRRANALKPGRRWLVNLSELHRSYCKMVAVRIRGKKRRNTKSSPHVVIFKRRRKEIHQPYNFSFSFQNAFFPPMISYGPSYPREEGRKGWLVRLSDKEVETQSCLLLGRTTAFLFGSKQIAQVCFSHWKARLLWPLTKDSAILEPCPGHKIACKETLGSRSLKDITRQGVIRREWPELKWGPNTVSCGEQLREGTSSLEGKKQDQGVRFKERTVIRFRMKPFPTLRVARSGTRLSWEEVDTFPRVNWKRGLWTLQGS